MPRQSQSGLGRDGDRSNPELSPIGQVFQACMQGDVKLMKSLIKKHKVDPKQGYNIHALLGNSSLYSSMNTLLHAAILSNSSEAIDAAIKLLKIKMKWKDYYHNSHCHDILLFAFYNGKINAVKHLFKKYEAHVHLDGDGEAEIEVLGDVIECGDVETVKFYIQNSDSSWDIIDSMDDYNHLFHIAVDNKSHILKYFVTDFKRDINCEDESKQSSLQKYVANRDWEMVKFLMQEFSTKLKINVNILHRAVQDHNIKTQMIDYFISTGIDPNGINVNGQTPIMLATKFGNVNIFNHLINRYDVNVKSTCLKGANLFHYIALLNSNNINNIKSMFTTLIAKPELDINHHDNDGHTPLYYANLIKNQPLIDLFVENNAKDDDDVAVVADKVNNDIIVESKAEPVSITSSPTPSVQ